MFLGLREGEIFVPYQLYYSLLSEINQNIINQNSFGTTILHASRSKEQILLLDFEQYKEILILFYELEIIYQKKISNIKKIMSLLTEKYIN